MNRQQVIADLRNVLATLYPDRAETRRLVDDAGINPAFIDFRGTPISVWHAILTEASKKNQIQLVLAAANQEYPDNKELHRLTTAYAEASTQPTLKGTPVENPTSAGFDPTADLQRSLAQGNVCAFVGAGLSMGAGLPGWYDLLSELAQRIGYADLPPRQWASSEALIDAAQVYINQRGLQSLIAFLKERLDAFDKAPTAAHRALAQLPITLAFTANYDALLERAYRDAGKRIALVVRDGDLPYLRRGPDVVNIVKLYGDLNQPDTLVLARQQYERFFLERPQMLKLLETELTRSDVLYLGWSHTDPHFNLIFGELLSRFAAMMRPGYAALFDLPAARAEELRRRQIRLVQLPDGTDYNAQLTNWLQGLVTEVQGSRSLQS